MKYLLDAAVDQIQVESILLEIPKAVEQKQPNLLVQDPPLKDLSHHSLEMQLNLLTQIPKNQSPVESMVRLLLVFSVENKKVDKVLIIGNKKMGIQAIRLKPLKPNLHQN